MRSPFDWNTGEPSVFNNPRELSYVANAKTMTARQTKKPKVPPAEKRVRFRKSGGRPVEVSFDLDAAKAMRSEGSSYQEIAHRMGRSPDTIARRLNPKQA